MSTQTDTAPILRAWQAYLDESTIDSPHVPFNVFREGWRAALAAVPSSSVPEGQTRERAAFMAGVDAVVRAWNDQGLIPGRNPFNISPEGWFIVAVASAKESCPYA